MSDSREREARDELISFLRHKVYDPADWGSGEDSCSQPYRAPVEGAMEALKEYEKLLRADSAKARADRALEILRWVWPMLVRPQYRTTHNAAYYDKYHEYEQWISHQGVDNS